MIDELPPPKPQFVPIREAEEFVAKYNRLWKEYAKACAERDALRKELKALKRHAASTPNTNETQGQG